MILPKRVTINHVLYGKTFILYGRTFILVLLTNDSCLNSMKDSFNSWSISIFCFGTLESTLWRPNVAASYQVLLVWIILEER